LVGLDSLKTALILSAIDPSVGGVLLRGEKGTAKSTAARALADILPPIRRAAKCSFNCDPDAPWSECPSCAPPAPRLCGGRGDGGEGGQHPSQDLEDFRGLESPPHPSALPPQSRGEREHETTPVPLVTLPLGATEDRVLGTLDFERALREGRRAFQPGLLAAAHRGILYIDEVNLLPDHLVDVLLDAAALGVNTVQREGISAAHPARFLLIGTMNREEGDLRPQLLDRFGLMVEVVGPRDAELRAEVVHRRLTFESDPAAFAARWEGEQDRLRRRIVEARERLPRVVLNEALLTVISRLCCE